MIPLERPSEPQRARLSVDDFLVLADAGAFAGRVDRREIRVANVVHRRHACIHAVLGRSIGNALADTDPERVLNANPTARIADDRMRGAGFAVGVDEDGRTVTRHDLRIAIGISHATLPMDLGRKARLYARTGVPEYGVVDCEGRVVHQMRAPAGEGFATRHMVRAGEPMGSATLPGLTLDVTTPV